MAFVLEFNKNPPRIVKRGRVTTVTSSRIGVPISPTWGYCCYPPSKGKSRSSSSSRGKKRSRSRDKERTSMSGCVWKWDTGYPKNIQTRYFQYIGKINDKPLDIHGYFFKGKNMSWSRGVGLSTFSSVPPTMFFIIRWMGMVESCAFWCALCTGQKAGATL